MRLADTGTAAVLAVLMAATWTAPALVDRHVTADADSVAPGTTDTLDATTATVSFVAPAGWTREPSGETTRARYRKGDREIRVAVLQGVTDPAAAEQRRLAALHSDGLAAAFDGGTARGGDGFAGRHCVVVDPGTDVTGDCAIVTSEGVVATVVSTSSTYREYAPIQPLLDSLDVRPADAEGRR